MIRALPAVCAGLPPEFQQEAAGWLDVVNVEAGETVMLEGEEDSTLAFISTGTCEVWRGETKVGTAGSREMLGEVEVFARIPRVCTVTASTPMQLHLLGPEGLTALAERGNPVVHHIERAAIRRISERISKFNEGIREYSHGRPFALHPRQPSLIDQLTAPFRRRQKVPVLDRAAILRSSEPFSWAPEPVLDELASQFEVERFDPEQLVCRQGEESDRMYLIASGTIEVVVRTGEDRAETVGTFGPGETFEDAALCLSSPRTASGAARGEVVALTLDQARFRAWVESDEVAGAVLRQGVLRSLTVQLLASMDRYAAAVARSAPQDEGSYKGTPLNAMWRD